MAAVKWSEKVEVLRDEIYAPLCDGLYKEEDGYIVTWSGIYPYTNMNCFTWSNKDTDYIVPGDQYIKEFKNWLGHINND